MLAKTPHITDIPTLFAQFFAPVQGYPLILKQLLRLCLYKTTRYACNIRQTFGSEYWILQRL